MEEGRGRGYWWAEPHVCRGNEGGAINECSHKGGVLEQLIGEEGKEWGCDWAGQKGMGLRFFHSGPLPSILLF